MKQIIEVKVYTSSPYKIIKYIRNRNINIYNVIYNKNNINIWIEEKYYKDVSKIYNAEIIKHVGVSKLIDIKNVIFKHISILFIIISLIIFYSSIIVKIELTTVNNELRNNILFLLEDKGIKKFTFRKSNDELFKIKEEILASNKDLLEWINIEQHGMKYVINVEPRILKEIKDEHSFCNIVALKDGTITKVVSSLGVEVVEKNESVKQGDILISGEIKKDEEVKSNVCATGKVYAKTWYTIDISMTKTYEKVTKLDKERYNLLVKANNKRHKIFNSRLEEFITEDKKILDIFGVELYLQKEIQTKVETVLYDEDGLNKRIDELVNEKMKTVLKGNGQILMRKVLKKVENDSTIDMSIFIVAEEEIGEQQILE